MHTSWMSSTQRTAKCAIFTTTMHTMSRPMNVPALAQLGWLAVTKVAASPIHSLKPHHAATVFSSIMREVDALIISYHCCEQVKVHYVCPSYLYCQLSDCAVRMTSEIGIMRTWRPYFHTWQLQEKGEKIREWQVRTAIGWRKTAVNIGVHCCLHAATCGSFIRPWDFWIATPNIARNHFVGTNACRFSFLKMISVCFIYWKVHFTSLERGFKYMYVYGDSNGNFVYFVIFIISLYPVIMKFECMSA